MWYELIERVYSVSSKCMAVVLHFIWQIQNSFLVNQRNSVQAAFSNVNLCIQQGIPLSHECTVIDTLGIGSTIWQGDTFECIESSNQITLSHSRYKVGESGVCGNFSAMSIEVNGSEYTSRLTIYGSIIETTTINCTLAGAILVQTINVKIGG